MADDTPADYDSPWKEALALYFREFLQLLQPELHAQIDWSVAPTFLDKEVQAGRVSQSGLRDMAGRMYQYSHRIEDQYLVSRHLKDGRPASAHSFIRLRQLRCEIHLPCPILGPVVEPLG